MRMDDAGGTPIAPGPRDGPDADSEGHPNFPNFIARSNFRGLGSLCLREPIRGWASRRGRWVTSNRDDYSLKRDKMVYLIGYAFGFIITQHPSSE